MESSDCVLARDMSARSVGLYRTQGDELSAVWPRMSFGWALLHEKRRNRSAAAAAGQQCERAVRLAGVAAHIRDQIGRPLIDSESGLAEAWIGPLRERFGHEKFEALWREGQARAVGDVIAYALCSRASNRFTSSPSSLDRVGNAARVPYGGGQLVVER